MAAMTRVQLFLSTVSAEFRSYRDALSGDLVRPNVSVAVQEDFIATGTETLDKLDDYIRACEAVIHLVGDMTGAWAHPAAVKSIKVRYPDLAERLPAIQESLEKGSPPLSYTQWEAYLAIYHGKVLIVAVPKTGAPRDAKYALQNDQHDAQQAHLERLKSLGRYPEINFESADRLSVQVLRSKLHDILAKAAPATKPIALPYPSLGTLFKGRDALLAALRESLSRAKTGRAAAIVGKALHGLGGVGKTRLAVEYAWQHVEDYSALLFVTADAPDALRRNLAALCGPELLDLPEQSAPEESKRVAAVLRWLQNNPGWLLILDNLDTPAAAAAGEQLLASLHGGDVLLTSRLADWSGSVEALALDLLPLDASRDFLLERTDARRRKTADDPTQATTLATELDRLALALEQAGAYIAQQRLSFTSYLQAWRDHREKVIEWFDERLMQYPRSVAVTWQTSVDQLSEPARRLLHRLAWFAPDPIPESLLEVFVAGEDNAEVDRHDALAELETYSLVTRAADAPTFSVHRLVQDVTRRTLRNDTNHRALNEALRWANAAFVGDPQDVRTWPALDPLVSHARAVAEHADGNGIADPTGRLMNQLGVLLEGKALHADAESLYRQALEIDEASYGPEHPDVARDLNNLAGLLQATNRLADAEPLFRRVVKIFEASLGANHPNVATALNNLAELLRATNRLADAETLYRRALKIDEASYGPEHPTLAIRLNNLAGLLQATNRLADAEPLRRRVVKIFEASLGADHPNVATALNNLAGLLQATNRLADAEPLYRRALKIDEASYGPEHPDVATDLNNLAELLRATNRLADAEPLSRRSVEIILKFKRNTGHEHPHLKAAFDNYESLLKAMGKTEAEIQATMEALRASPD